MKLNARFSTCLRATGLSLFGSFFLTSEVFAQLDVPKGGRRDRGAPSAENQPGEPVSPERGDSADEAGEGMGAYSPDATGRARFLLDELGKVRKLDSSIVRRAEDDLVLLGPVGLSAARLALPSSKAPTLVCVARVLLRGGTAEDRKLVAERLTKRVPLHSAAPLLRELAQADPVLVSPEYLMGLLDHPTGGMRSAANRVLDDVVGVQHFARLNELLGSKQRDTRLRALGLLSSLRDPAVERVLIDRLGDSAPNVAWAAARTLAERRGELATSLLLERAFRGNRIDRGGAYALLSIVEREDRDQSALLDETHVNLLLSELRSDSALIAGSAAAALAGIGFRSESIEALDWLDLGVPHQLIRVSSGAEFHKDFGSLQEPAQRRLQLISGENYATDGGAWSNWWRGVAGSFHARRAVLHLEPGQDLALELFLRNEEGEGQTLLGPKGVATHARSGNVTYLNEDEVEALVGYLREEGLLDARRLPMTEPSLTAKKRVFDLSFVDVGKRFEVSTSRSLPWLDRVFVRVESFADSNSWQRYFPSRTFSNRHVFWQAEHGFWESNTDQARARSKRREYLFGFLEEQPKEQRVQAIHALLDSASGLDGKLSSAELPRLLAVTFDEPYFNDQCQDLLELALDTARGPTGVVPGDVATDLLERAVVAWPKGANRAADAVLAAAGIQTTFQLANSEEPRVRAFAARSLGTLEGAEVEERLLVLLGDEDRLVEAAAVRSLGVLRVERTRDELLLRARIADRGVRAEALRAIGLLGGEGVRDALLVALVETDPMINLAAVDAMAELRDPRLSTTLTRIFARGPGDHLFQSARLGLARLGQSAVDDLLRLSASAAPRTRREASLLLAEGSAPEAAPLLIARLTDDVDDARVASELAILTGVDFRSKGDPAEAWWSWWDQVVHDDSVAWYVGALGREGIDSPPVEDLRGMGSRRGALFLWDQLSNEQRHLAVRAERELARLLGRPSGGALDLSRTRGDLRDRELAKLRLEIDVRFAN